MAIRRHAAAAAHAVAAALLFCAPGHGQVTVGSTVQRDAQAVVIDFASMATGSFPSALQPLHGVMGVVESGGRWLEATSKSAFVVPLGQPLAERFVIEFDVTLPPNGLTVYFAERWGISDRHLFNGSWPHPFVVLSATEAGVRERPHAGGAVRTPSDVLGREVANGEVVQLRIEGDASSLKVLLNGQPAGTAMVVVPRTDRIFIETTGEAHTAAQRSPELIPTRIGAIRVTGPTASIGAGSPPVAAGSRPLVPTALPHVEAARQLRAAGTPAQTAATQLEADYGLSEVAVVGTLLEAGYTEQEVAAMLRDRGRTVVQAIGVFLSAVPASMEEQTGRAVAALWAAYGKLEGSAIVALVQGGVTLERVAAALRAAGVPLAERAEALIGAALLASQAVATWGHTAGLSVQHAGHAIWKLDQPGAPQFASLMQASGVGPGEVLVSFADFYGMPLAQAVQTLGTRFPAEQIIAGGIPLGLTAPSAATALHAGGHAVSVILTAIAHHAGALPPQVSANVAAALGSQLVVSNTTAEQRHSLSAVLSAAEALAGSVDPQLLAATTMSVIASVVIVVVSIVVAVFLMVQGLGYSSGPVVAALVSNLLMASGDAADAARQAGLPVSEVIQTLVEVARPAAMDEAAFVAETMRAGKYDAQQTALVLRTNFQRTAQQTAVAMSKGGFTFAQIRDALVDAYQLSLTSVLQLLATLGIG
jgi:hypothetical protein